MLAVLATGISLGVVTYLFFGSTVGVIVLAGFIGVLLLVSNWYEQR